MNGSPAKEQTLRADADHDKSNPRITYGTLNFYVIRRADRFAVRLKDAKSPSLGEFHGLNWYSPDAAYQVTAKWVPYNPAKKVSLITLVGTSYQQPVPGYAEFTLQGKSYRLEPVLEDPQSSKLFFILKDPTSADTTYPACRFLYTPLPAVASIRKANWCWTSITWKILLALTRPMPPARCRRQVTGCPSLCRSANSVTINR